MGPATIAVRRRQIAEIRLRLKALSPGRARAVAFTHLDNAEVILETPHLHEEAEKVDMSFDYLILAWGFLDRADTEARRPESIDELPAPVATIPTPVPEPTSTASA